MTHHSHPGSAGEAQVGVEDLRGEGSVQSAHHEAQRGEEAFVTVSVQFSVPGDDARPASPSQFSSQCFAIPAKVYHQGPLTLTTHPMEPLAT